MTFPVSPAAPDPGLGTHGRRRDRRGRGLRGPYVLPRDPGTPALGSTRARFDGLVLRTIAPLDAQWQDRLGLVEYAVEDTPILPDDWTDPVPLSSLTQATRGTPARLVLFRRPIEARCGTRRELADAVLGIVVERLAELLGVEPGTVDPRFASE